MLLARLTIVLEYNMISLGDWIVITLFILLLMFKAWDYMIDMIVGEANVVFWLMIENDWLFGVREIVVVPEPIKYKLGDGLVKVIEIELLIVEK